MNHFGFKKHGNHFNKYPDVAYLNIVIHWLQIGSQELIMAVLITTTFWLKIRRFEQEWSQEWSHFDFKRTKNFAHYGKCYLQIYNLPAPNCLIVF